MENPFSQRRPAPVASTTRTRWFSIGVALTLFFLAWLFQGDETGLWLPGLGLGIALVSWTSWGILPLLYATLVLARWLNQSAEEPWFLIWADAFLHVSQISLSWWVYDRVARCSRWLDDPRSATLFLILVPGGGSALAAILQAWLWLAERPLETPPQLGPLIAELWLGRMVGTLVATPFLLIVVTPFLFRLGVVLVEMPTSYFGEVQDAKSRQGAWIELIGLTFATSVLALVLLSALLNWLVWACCLIVIVWTCVRQGLRGGFFSAFVTSVVVLLAAQVMNFPLDFPSALQGNLLAFCSTALLVGVSSSWVRVNESRYHHVAARIPVVLYSARLPYGVPTLVVGEQGSARTSRREGKTLSISTLANVMLVSPAARTVFGCEPDALLGPFSHWLQKIEADDHELVVAALAQLCLQRQPVTCEYRLRAGSEESAIETALADILPRSPQTRNVRWVRDTLMPHYSEDGLLDGWEGLVEEITAQRALSQHLRKITNMLQALITNLPMGIFFVQAPLGYPILVNARARQLLGQREDMSAGLSHLSTIYRLYRPDGTQYPSEELPISRAVRLGTTCRANDIVVHRADGRKIPLIAWAAPIDLANTGVPDAAVWVLEDLSATQEAEVALRESEIRLRTIIETMGEGLIVQDQTGTIVECNPAACTILGVTKERLLLRSGLAGDHPCYLENGVPVKPEERPDQRALKENAPARGVILGMPIGPEGKVRWLLVNSVPFPAGHLGGLNHQRARVVTTFADITYQLQTQESLSHAKEKYQDLIENLPFMMVQHDRQGQVTYLNPASRDLAGYSDEQWHAPGFFQQVLLPADRPNAEAATGLVLQGKSTRLELRLLAADGTTKTLEAFVYPNYHEKEVVGSTSLLIDITTQRRLEEELVRAKHLELVGKLASGTVHDFNNLLAVMISLTELAKMEVPDSHPIFSYLKRLSDVGEQATHLAGQVLAFGKERTKNLYAVDLNVTITQTLGLLESVLPAEISVETELLPSLPTVSSNETHLKQILMNLCLNARDAMPRGGTLRISTDLELPPANRGAAKEGKKWVHLSIQDTGIGIPEDVRQRIFDPFFTTKERGTGLGLALVHQLITDFGGLIAVSSQPNMGTRMNIWLFQAEQT